MLFCPDPLCVTSEKTANEMQNLKKLKILNKKPKCLQSQKILKSFFKINAWRLYLGSKFASTKKLTQVSLKDNEPFGQAEIKKTGKVEQQFRRLDSNKIE